MRQKSKSQNRLMSRVSNQEQGNNPKKTQVKTRNSKHGIRTWIIRWRHRTKSQNKLQNVCDCLYCVQRWLSPSELSVLNYSHCKYILGQKWSHSKQLHLKFCESIWNVGQKKKQCKKCLCHILIFGLAINTSSLQC